MKHITFPNTQGLTLAARIDLPSSAEVRTYALFAHCFTCGKDNVAAARIARTLAARGIGILRFDFAGLGASEGDFSNTNFTSNVQDLIAAADFMRREYGPPHLLIGHSLGGTAVLAATKHIPDARAVVTIASPFCPSHAAVHFQDRHGEILEQGAAEVNLAGRPFVIKSQFIEDITSHNMHEHIRRLGRALLVMHAPTDAVVGVENAAQIFEVAKHPKSFVSLDTANHLLTHVKDSIYAAEVIAAWVTRYV